MLETMHQCIFAPAAYSKSISRVFFEISTSTRVRIIIEPSFAYHDFKINYSIDFQNAENFDAISSTNCLFEFCCFFLNFYFIFPK